MKPSKNYYIKMFSWRNKDYQRRLLFEEKCPYKFRKTNCCIGKLLNGRVEIIPNDLGHLHV